MRSLAFPIAFVLAMLGLARPAKAETVRLDARALYERSTSTNLRIAGDGSAIELDWGELFEDDGPAAGFSYKSNEEKLSATTWIKKEFILPNPQAKKAALLIGGSGTLRALVNGKPHDLGPAIKVGNYWQAFTLPTELLSPGKNDLVLHGNGKVWIARDDEFAAGSRTRTKHPNRSAKSNDAGKTWDYDRLGSAGNIDGEYYVRLFLEHFQPHGTLTSPIFDAGNLGGNLLSPPIVSLGPVRIDVQAETAKTGRNAVRVRSGTTCAPDAKNWSAWQPLGDGGVLAKPLGRFLQVAVELTSADPLLTPRLKGLAIEATPKVADDWTKNIRVIEQLNEVITRTSIPFEYEPFGHPRLKQLRQQHKLDEVVKDAKSELDIITRLAAWSAARWQRGHLRDAYPAWDALDILKPHADGAPVGGFCQQYNVVFLQACGSFGLVGRAVSIGPGESGAKIRSGHEVVEIWSNEHKKWIYVDGQMAWYFTDGQSATPLSLLELRERQLLTLRGNKASPVKLVKLADIGQDWKGFDAFPPFVELRLIPRSNFLQEKSPIPLNQGMRGWFWTGHYAWTDDDEPAALLYGNRVRARRDWAWTMNQAHIVLEATNTPGEFHVHLDTETPGFDTFYAQIDGKAKQPVASGFVWRLLRGRNLLEVRPRNLAGREGIASRLVLDY